MKEAVAKSYCLTSVGRVRQSNEDSVAIIERPHFTLLAVCDGMGGHRKGEVASRIAIDTLEREFGNISNEVSTWKGKVLLKKCLSDANLEIFDMSQSDTTYEGMGTTAVVALVLKEEMIIANVGDSRCYETTAKRKTIKPLTVDQSFVEILYEKGKITKAQMLHHPNKNIITNALGIKDKLKCDIKVYKTDFEDLMLCSDGLTNMVPESQISLILKRDATVENKAITLINRANDLGGLDNVSVALMERK